MPDTDVWTTRQLLAWTTQHFEKHRLDAPRVRAEMLLGHVLHTPRLRLYMEPDRPADADERQALRELVQRATRHEPVDYLTGKTTFFGLEFAVSPAVLIPRPSTETLVEHVLQALGGGRSTGHGVTPLGGPAPESETGIRGSGFGLRDEREEATGSPGESAPDTPLNDRTPSTSDEPHPKPEARNPTPDPPALRLADLCTGSGAIAITLLKHLPHATAVATDLSEDALHVAQQNAQHHGVADRLELRAGDGLSPLMEHAPTERFDALVANPPYIPDPEWAEVTPDVKDHEPTLALRGGVDGLDVLRPLIAGARQHVKPGGWLAFEIAAVQADAVRTLAEQAGWRDIEVLDDHERLPRVLVGRA